MPEGPLGFPRLTDLGPLVESEEFGWHDCPVDDAFEERLCKTIKEETLKLMEDDPNVNEIDDVNNGYCYWIADSVYVELGGPEDLVIVENHSPMGTNHAYLRYNGKFYDAEVPDGVHNLKDLPFIQRYPNLIIDDETQIRSEGETYMGLTPKLEEFLNNE